MSFSSDVKDELSQRFPESYHCLLAEIAALIRYTGETSPLHEQGYIHFETENVVLAKRFLRLIKMAFDIQVDLSIHRRMSGTNQYSITLTEREIEADEWENTGDRFQRVWCETCDWRNPGFERALLEYSCCRRAFLRGAFLAVGSMSNPGKSYHFEIVCRQESEAQTLVRLMENFDIHPKIVLRKRKHVVYLKDSTEIVDLLNVMEAPKSLMELENIRIIKDMRNSANRQYNCDSANINKMVRTASRQVDDIRFIQENMGFDRLPPTLKEMAIVRLEHPDESLKELGNYLNPPVGKSGVNHRLKKLGEIANSLRE